MTAEFFLAVRAVQATVGGRGKALGVQPIGDLQSQKKRQSASEHAVCIPACHKRKRCEHHGKIPVVDTAGGTAPILHYPGLEGTEEKYTDNIAHRITDGNNDQNAPVNDARVVQNPDHGVERKPHRCYQRGSLPRLILRHTRLTHALVIPRKLLLASHAFQLGRKETEEHFSDTEHPNNGRQDCVIGQHVGAVQNVENKNRNEQHRAQYQLNKMQS